MTRVLVVENDPLVERVLVGVLERNGYEVVCHHTVAEAVAAADSVDIVVTDLGLDGMADGRLIVEQVGGRVPVVVVSGSVEALRGVPGAATVVEKPFRHAELLEALRAALR